MAYMTLLDVAKMNGSDKITGLVQEVGRAFPELTGIHPVTGVQVPFVGDSRTIKGMNYKTLVVSALPTVGFRNANEGTASSTAVYENRLVECFTMNPTIIVDKKVADSSEDGPEALIAREAAQQLKSSMTTIGKQMFYGTGTGGDAKGFPGFINIYDSTNMVVDAGGTTASTGSSVWAVSFGPDAVQWVWGLNGALTMDDVSTQLIADSNSYYFSAYTTSISAYPGLQVSTPKAISRIKKLTADSGKGLTDSLLADLVATFPVGFQPNCIFASRRSIAQLQKSRTSYNPAGRPADYPTEFQGIPILPCDEILNTESLTL